jgi:hypothetical protein
MRIWISAPVGPGTFLEGWKLANFHRRPMPALTPARTLLAGPRRLGGTVLAAFATVGFLSGCINLVVNGPSFPMPRWLRILLWRYVNAAA